ncbi:hypothetical protein [Flagellimonas sp.]|uniref:hypothetical protein n=1 Tax=Flagellimonas sp. TaxID=2058762 RepID=UPI003AB270FA
MMNHISYIKKGLVMGLCALTMSSCLLDDEKTDFGKGANLVGFASSSLTVRAEANGEEVSSQIPIRIIGPTVKDFRDDITVTVEVDPSSTAVEGVNFRLDINTVTLSPDGSDMYEGNLPITILTDGIMTPVDVAPILNLSITQVSSEGNIVINDKTENVSASIAYTCPFSIADYEGTYIATTDEFGIYIGETLPFEVVTGPGENQITLVNVAAHPEEYDVVVDVDPSTGNLTIPRQPALNYTNFGATPYGELSWEGSGTSAPSPGYCVGILDVTNGYFVAAGTFGQFRTVFEKQ